MLESPTQVFSVKFEKFLRTPILKNICEQLLLRFQKSHVINSFMTEVPIIIETIPLIRFAN